MKIKNYGLGHIDGTYENICLDCKEHFIGYKNDPYCGCHTVNDDNSTNDEGDWDGVPS